MAKALDGEPEEIRVSANKISRLAPRIGAKEIRSADRQGNLISLIEKDVGGIGMGVLSDGTPYLNQRGLAALCGVQNAHVGTISSQWSDGEQKPRIIAVKAVLSKAGFSPPSAAHVEIAYGGTVHYCYPAEICLAVLEYYAFDAGTNCQPEARHNFRLLAGSKLREMIYSQVGYDPSGRNADRFKNWHDRVALNHQSAPKGFFCVFNEAHTIFYELIQAGADVGPSVVVDISIGQHWSKYWTENDMEVKHGARRRFPHRYPDSHPQARSNPQDSWCYPVAALGAYRMWLQDDYIEGGKFGSYLKGKVARNEIPTSVAQLAIAAIVPPQIAAPPP